MSKICITSLPSFKPLAAHPAISTGNSNVEKSSRPAIYAGIFFSSFMEEYIQLFPQSTTVINYIL